MPLLLERSCERTQIGAPIYIGAQTQIRARTCVRPLHACWLGDNRGICLGGVSKPAGGGLREPSLPCALPLLAAISLCLSSSLFLRLVLRFLPLLFSGRDKKCQNWKDAHAEACQPLFAFLREWGYEEKEEQEATQGRGKKRKNKKASKK